MMGENIIIQDDVEIGNNAVIGNNVVIFTGTKIGDSVSIQGNAVLGKQPKMSPISTVKADILEPLVIGDNCSINTSVVICAGSKLGNHVMLGDLATIREKCRVGNYTVVGQKVSIENEVRTGANTKIQTGAYITAYTEIEDHVFIAPMVITANDNFMGRTEKRLKLKKGPSVKYGARIGAGAILLPGITIGEEAFVAAGSIVTKDVPPYKLVMGNPARVVRDVPEEELLEHR